MLQRERAENLHRLLQNCENHKKAESGLGCGLDITPIHVSLDSSLCALFLAETAGGGLCGLRCDGRNDCATKAFLSGEFFPNCIDLFRCQRALILSTAGAARWRGSFAIPEWRQASR